MRVADEWTKEDMRVQVFIMNGRYSLKVEKNLLEQTFKFRDGQIESMDHLKSLLTDAFYGYCSNIFIHMDLNRSKLFPDMEQEDTIEII